MRKTGVERVEPLVGMGYPYPSDEDLSGETIFCYIGVPHPSPRDEGLSEESEDC